MATEYIAARTELIPPAPRTESAGELDAPTLGGEWRSLVPARPAFTVAGMDYEASQETGTRGQASSRRVDFVLPYGPGDPVTVTHKGEEGNPLRRGNRLTWPGFRLVLRRVIIDFPTDAMVDKGATLTYYTVLSLAPMLLATYSVVTLLLPRDEDAADSLMYGLIDSYVPKELQADAVELLRTIVGTPGQSSVALAISLIISLLSASAYVRSFSRNANLIYGRTEGRNVVVTWLTMWLITLVLVVGGVIILLGTFLTESIVNAVLGPIAKPLQLQDALDYLNGIFLPIWDYARVPVIAVTAVALVSVLYYLAPNVRPGRFRLLTLGSSLALLVIALIWVAFGWYLSTIGIRSTYGAFGTVLAVFGLVWVMNIVLLEGVKVDAEVLRAKELQIGLDSTRLIQAPPRSNAGALWRAKTQRWADKAAENITQRLDDDPA